MINKVPGETRPVNGVTALMVEQEMVQRTHLVEATDMGHSLQICSAELSFHGQKNTAVTAGLGPSDVVQVPAGETPSRRQGKHLWRALGSKGDPPCSFEMTLEQCQGTAALPWYEKGNRGFHKGETAASKTSKDNTCCKTLMVKTIKVPRLFQTAPALGFLIIKIMSLNQKRSLKPSFCILLQLQS